MTVEFKSDRNKLTDSALAQAAVCLANAEGGTIYVGVDDDGAISGLHSDRKHVEHFADAIARRTVAPLGVRANPITPNGVRVAVIEVPKATRITATADGKVTRRRQFGARKPECVPFLPYEHVTRASDLGRLDYSALPVEGSGLDDFSPVERDRLREIIRTGQGERNLLELSDEELEKALRLTADKKGRRIPTVAGLLLLGKEDALQERIPTHEVALQDLQRTEVRANEFYRKPLLRIFEKVEQFYQARVVEEEIQEGMFRVPVPSLDKRAYREVVVNALVHRDYTRLGAVHIRWNTESLTVSNPGGFVDGVTADNILVTEPRSRNPVLADAFKRIGLAERTGRGIDLVYQGSLRYGRPRPSFAGSNSTTVVVKLICAKADLEFVSLVMDQENRAGRSISIDSLIVLSHLRETRRTDGKEVASLIQKDLREARGVLERLVESGLVQAQGSGRGRRYTLSSGIYKRLGKPEAYTRQAGFSRIQQEQMVLSYVDQHGSIRRAAAMDLCVLSGDQATRLLKGLVAQGRLVMRGEKKGAHYVRE